MRFRSYNALVAATLSGLAWAVVWTGFAGVHVHAESISRSDPQTEGERRLLEWDTTRKFTPFKSTFVPGNITGSKTVAVKPFATQPFASKSAVTTPSFYTPEFLSSSAAAAQKKFATAAAPVSTASSLEKPFNAGKTTAETQPFAGVSSPSNMAKASPDGARPFLGPEADKMKQKYTPLNAPKGGFSTGHQLTVEEVRAILNRNK